MAIVVDMHKHISTATEGRSYFPWQQRWHVCMNWAYGKEARKLGDPRDPEALYPRQDIRMADPEGKWAVQDMDEGGVDVSVCLPIDYSFSHGSESSIGIEEKQQHLAEMQEKYPGRIIGFAGPDPRRPGAVEILTRGIKEYGLKGLKLIPKAGYYMWQEDVYRLLDVAHELDIPVAACTQPSGGGYNRTRFADPMHVDDAVCDFPDVKFIILHAGAPLMEFFEKALLVASRNHNVYLQFDFWIHGFFGVPKFIPNFKTDAESVGRLLGRARDVVGAHNMLYGTDTHSGPSVHGDTLFRRDSGFNLGGAIAWLRDLPNTARQYGVDFTNEEVDMILGESAARLLGIKEYPKRETPHTFGWKRRSPSVYRGGA